MAGGRKALVAQRTAFIEAIAETGGNVARACEIAKIGRRTPYVWRQQDPEFAKAWEEAVAIGGDVLESEAIRRAHDGVLEPVFQKGIKVGEVRRYSDQLLIRLLEAAKPEKYRQRSTVELNLGPAIQQLEAARRRRLAVEREEASDQAHDVDGESRRVGPE